MKLSPVRIGAGWLRRCSRAPKTSRGHYGRKWRVVHGNGLGQVVCDGCATTEQMRAKSPSRQRLQRKARRR